MRDQIVFRSSSGDRIEDIERELIDPAPANEDERAALWLLAWSTKGNGSPL